MVLKKMMMMKIDDNLLKKLCKDLVFFWKQKNSKLLVLSDYNINKLKKLYKALKINNLKKVYLHLSYVFSVQTASTWKY